MHHSIVCHHCHHTWSVSLPLGRRDECPTCGKDGKVCLNCQFFDRNAYHQCRESEAEWVKEKDLGNFCSYFRPRGSQDSKNNEADDAKAKLKALFGDKT